MSWWDESGLTSSQQVELADCPSLDWSSLPASVHPEAGSLPQDRLERKCGQLSSLAVPLTQLAGPGDLMVDFCSGGGHLGLLLAHLLPAVTLHMVENKEESLARARARGQQMNLSNVWFYQCNLEFYRGPFNIGKSGNCGNCGNLPSPPSCPDLARLRSPCYQGPACTPAVPPQISS